jgi:hypothetical protein
MEKGQRDGGDIWDVKDQPERQEAEVAQSNSVTSNFFLAFYPSISYFDSCVTY